MEIRELPLHDLVLDPTLNLRDRLDQDTVERYAEAWSRLPPVTVFEIDGKWILADGFHRHAAAVILGRRTIKAEIRSGTMAEALDYVAGANLFHGLPLSRAERRRALEIKLRLHHDRSDRHLAEELCVSRELVAKVRRQLVEAGQIPAGTTRIGADGKTYPALPKDPNERLPRGPAIAQQDEEDDEPPIPPWKDAGRQSRPVNEGPPRRVLGADRDAPDARTAALAPPAPPSTASIVEMLGLMTQQVMEVVAWTNAEGFAEAYRSASANARGLFQTAVIKLAARADQLRKA